MSMDLHSVQVVPHPDDVASEDAREQRNSGGGGGLQLPSYRNAASSPFPPQTRSGGPTPQSASGYFNSDFENENLSPCNLADFPDPDGGSVGSELRGAVVSNSAGAPPAGPTSISHPSAFRPPPPVPALQSHDAIDQYPRVQHRYRAASSSNQQHHQADYMSSSGPDQLFSAANNAPPTNHSMSHNESYDNLSMPDTFWDAPVGVEHVNWLMSYCQIVRREEPITSLRQCTSSLFVLVFQRIFNCNIKNIELDPNTHEKRLHNIQRVLEELEANILSASGDHVSLSHISAEEIVLVNEDHIAMLVQVFIDIAQAVMRHAQFDRAGGAVARGTQNGHPYTKNYNSANGGGTAGDDVGAGGVGVPPLRQQLLEDIASEVSAADSADKTQQLVSKWQLELVHPLDQRRGNPSIPHSAVKATTLSLDQDMLNLRRRMLHFDELLTTPTKARRSSALIDASRISTPHHGKPSIGSQSSNDFPKSRQSQRAAHIDPTATGGGMMTVQKIQGGIISRAATGRSSSRGISTNNKKKRATPSRQLVASASPYVPASTYATFPPDTYHMARTLDTEARDHKIEQLRSLKFIQETCATVRADIVTKASEKQVAIAAANKEYAKRKARDLRDIKSLIRDEDDRYKQAYRCIMTSARNDLERYGNVVDRHSRHVFTKNQAAIVEAEQCAEEAKEQQEDFISNRTRKYSRAVSGWRTGTIAAA